MGLAIAGVAFSGCNGGPDPKMATKEEVEALRAATETKDRDQAAELDRRIKEVKETLASDVAALNKRFTEATQEYALVQAKFEAMKNILNNFEALKKELDEHIKSIDAKVTTGNANLITALKAEAKLLEDRLVEIKRTIEDLEKPR